MKGLWIWEYQSKVSTNDWSRCESVGGTSNSVVPIAEGLVTLSVCSKIEDRSD